MAIYKGDVTQRALWVAILGTATLAGSYVFACATPFAALAALAAIFLPRRDALILIPAAWLANQAIGYCVLDYPRNFDSFAWGAAIGIAAMLALFAGWAVERVFRQPAAAVIGVFAVSFLAYEAALTAATLILPAGGGFSLSAYGYVALVNGLAFAGLLALQGAGRVTGLASQRWASPAAA